MSGKERPILFSSPMVRALLDGRKTQTRRVVKPQPPNGARFTGIHYASTEPSSHFFNSPSGPSKRRCPYGEEGDRLWVREGHQRFDRGTCDQHVWYLAGRNANDYVARTRPEIDQDQPWPRDVEGPAGGAPYSAPSIHMPRWASRLTLEITEVRVERLQDISEADAAAEGLLTWQDMNDFPAWGWESPKHEADGFMTAYAAYRDLWKHINGPASWDANPWVWAVSFEVAS